LLAYGIAGHHAGLANGKQSQARTALQERLQNELPEQAYDALSQAHAIQSVRPDRYGDQFVQLVNTRLYDERFGLHWDNPQFIQAERLVY